VSVCPSVAERLKFTQVPDNVTLHLGATERVECRAEGKTRPRVRWQRADADATPGGRSLLPEHVIQSEDGRLQFNVVESSDAGLYACLASNEQGTINTTVRVDVVGSLPLIFSHSFYIQ